MRLAGSATKRGSRTYWSPDRRKRRHCGKGRSSRSGPARLSRFLEGAEFILKRQGHALQRPEDGHGTEKDKRRPQDQMDPCRRRQGQFQHQRQTDNDGADHEDAEDGRTVAGVVPARDAAAQPGDKSRDFRTTEPNVAFDPACPERAAPAIDGFFKEISRNQAPETRQWTEGIRT